MNTYLDPNRGATTTSNEEKTQAQDKTKKINIAITIVALATIALIAFTAVFITSHFTFGGHSMMNLIGKHGFQPLIHNSVPIEAVIPTMISALLAGAGLGSIIGLNGLKPQTNGNHKKQNMIPLEIRDKATVFL